MVLKTYSISGTIVSGNLDLNILHSEIDSSGAVTDFSGILTDGDNLKVMGASLANEATLDALIAAHDSGTVPKLRVYDLVADEFSFYSYEKICFRQMLKKDIYLSKEVDFGAHNRPTVARYYWQENLIAQLNWIFETNADNLLTRRKETIQYVYTDNTLTPEFVRKDQFYDLNRQDHRAIAVAERIMARGALVDDIKAVVLSFLTALYPLKTGQEIYDMGGDFLMLHNNAKDAFIEAGSDAFKNDINSDVTTTWLDDDLTALGFPGTIRQYMAGRLP